MSDATKEKVTVVKPTSMVPIVEELEEPEELEEKEQPVIPAAKKQKKVSNKLLTISLINFKKLKSLFEKRRQ